MDDRQIGFVAVEKADESLYNIEKLTILQELRHKGYGRNLIEFCFEHIKVSGAKKVSIGIINKHTVLKNYYKEIGFEETSSKEFAHLPFTVCFMEKKIYP